LLADVAQLLIRDRQKNPTRLTQERLFRWAVFINGGTPLEVFKSQTLK
jgi:hypothetical protein